jgi:hypothetical protein
MKSQLLRYALTEAPDLPPECILLADAIASVVPPRRIDASDDRGIRLEWASDDREVWIGVRPDLAISVWVEGSRNVWVIHGKAADPTKRVPR